MSNRGSRITALRAGSPRCSTGGPGLGHSVAQVGPGLGKVWLFFQRVDSCRILTWEKLQGQRGGGCRAVQCHPEGKRGRARSFYEKAAFMREEFLRPHSLPKAPPPSAIALGMKVQRGFWKQHRQEP